MGQLSESSLRTWMQQLGPQLIALSTGICRDQHRAEEIVQEAFIKLWKQPPDAGEVAYSSWLRKVVTNLSINALQRTKRPQALPEYSNDPAMRTRRDMHEEMDTQEELGRVSAAMERLDPGKRAILMLRAHEQLSYDDIAEHLGVPVGTVMSRLNRARAALLEEMKRDVQQEQDEPMVFEFRKYKQA